MKDIQENDDTELLESHREDSSVQDLLEATARAEEQEEVEKNSSDDSE